MIRITASLVSAAVLSPPRPMMPSYLRFISTTSSSSLSPVGSLCSSDLGSKRRTTQSTARTSNVMRLQQWRSGALSATRRLLQRRRTNSSQGPAIRVLTVANQNRGNVEEDVEREVSSHILHSRAALTSFLCGERTTLTAASE